jgi:hypothetical protein
MTKVDTFTFSDGLNPGRKQARLACVFGALNACSSLYKLSLLTALPGQAGDASLYWLDDMESPAWSCMTVFYSSVLA